MIGTHRTSCTRQNGRGSRGISRPNMWPMAMTLRITAKNMDMKRSRRRTSRSLRSCRAASSRFSLMTWYPAPTMASASVASSVIDSS